MLYAANGSINVKVSDGSGWKGLYSPEGYYWVTEAPASGFCGIQAPDGSLYLKASPGGTHGLQAPNGAIYYSETPESGSLYVTFVGGGFSGNKTITAAQGAYVITPGTTNLIWNRVLAAAQGSFSLTGNAATLTYTPATPTLLLDALSASPALAYSNRKLRSAYSGAPLAATTTQNGSSSGTDVAFSGTDLDTAALAALGSNVYLHTWYDQSTNSRNATTPTSGNRPNLRLSSSNITFGGKPALSTIQLDTATWNTASYSPAVPGTICAVFKWNSFNGARRFLNSGNSSALIWAQNLSNQNVFQWTSTAGDQNINSDTNIHAYCAVFNGASSAFWIDNSSNSFFTSNGSNWGSTGFSFGGPAASMTIAELVIFSSALSSGDISAYFSNVKAYYGTP